MVTRAEDTEPTAERKKTHYTGLSSKPEKEQDQVNLYAVVVDASYPYQAGTGKYITTLKVID